ncbi:hypothetical protein [Aneurinibacillus migulanus]|uniref:hypothetical protein n=1 Tax=Aneurinibacillus migulanus TaxID=47500 RepID=UPI00209ED89F|nr:hypothetical protein [Aneurinibacillus migulanus]MCP1354600.1 hypothetical protein [Aneurinibacillus migulanus]
MKLYFVVTDATSIEAEVVRKIQPERLLMSYHYFRTKGIYSFIEKIGYKPKEIILDSGAFSAATKGRNISPIDYMRFIDENSEYIMRYIALDVIGDPDLTRMYYDIMRFKGYNPVPVYHFGDEMKYLDYYVKQGADYVALGGCAREWSRGKVVQWVQGAIGKYPDVKFHFLGSSSRKITDHCDLYSADSSTWIMQAINGYPKEIPGRTRESKVLRAEWQMKRLIEEYAV